MPNSIKESVIENVKRPGRFEGKTVIITGGAAGIGRATALAFSNEGASIAIFDIQKEAGQEVVQLIRENGCKAEFIETDVTDAKQVDAAFDQVNKIFGVYDVLFNHAGTIIVKPLHESSEEDYDRLMDINVRSAFLVSRRAVREMSESGGGALLLPPRLPPNWVIHLNHCTV